MCPAQTPLMANPGDKPGPSLTSISALPTGNFDSLFALAQQT